MHRNAEKCRETQRNAEKCSEMHKNAAVLHHILGAIADHWCLGVIAIFHLRVGITAVHHMLSLGVMAVLVNVEQNGIFATHPPLPPFRAIGEKVKKYLHTLRIILFSNFWPFSKKEPSPEVCAIMG